MTLVLSDHFEKIVDLINSKSNFSISRFGDGEIRLINRMATNKCSKKTVFNYDPVLHEDFRVRLSKSFFSYLKNYYVGIPCNCCSNNSVVSACLRRIKSNVTFANIFVNYNFNHIEKLLDSISKKEVYMVCSKNSDTGNVPFKVKKFFHCSENVVNDLHIVDEVIKYIEQNDIKNGVFVFCAGPLSNILSYELFVKFPYNTYIDLGSVLDKKLYNRNTRKYHIEGHKNLNKNCKIKNIDKIPFKTFEK